MKNKKLKTQTIISEDQLDSDSAVESDSQVMASEEIGSDYQNSEENDSESIDSENVDSDMPSNDKNYREIEGINKSETNGSKGDKTKPNGLTVKELNNFRETEDLFNSNLFRLQLDQLLLEIKFKDKYRNRIDEWLKNFKSVLMSIESRKSYQLTDQLWCKSVKIPIIQEPFEVSGNFSFKTPKVCKIIGSYDLRTATGRQTLIDIAVEMPKDCWQRNDNLNHRYHRKRALYLSHICSAIKSNQLVSNIKFCYLNGNHMKPIALIEPNGSLSKHMRVALTLYPEHDNKSFRNNRFTPEKNNIRSEWTQMSDTSEEFESPTPTYNSCIQNDMNLISNYQYLVETIGESSPLRDGLILIKQWLKQRRLKNEFYFVISLFVCHLISKHKINHSFSCYQMFRTTLLSIVNSKWDTEGQAISEETYLPLSDYLSYFPVVFIDRSGYHNICWDITIDSYDRLRHESKLTIDCLDSNHKNGFELTFLTPISFESKFDVLLNVSVESILNSSKVPEITKDIVDNCGDTITAFVGHLIPLIKRTVGKRCLLVQHLSKSYDNFEWSSDQLPPHPNHKKWLTFGLLIDPQNAYNNIERGPPADSPEAKQFKDFWGQKSELRRFQDNAICEAVYWKTKTFADKRKIISKSLEFILTNILGIPLESLSTTASLLDPLLKRSHLKFSDKTVYGTGEELTFRITREFDDLAKRLRSLEALPLSITSVQPIDPVLRSTDVFPPLAMNSGKGDKSFNNCNVFDVSVEQKALKYFKPIEVIIQLEGSGKWPNDLDAFLRVKASFYLEMSQKLSQMFGIISYATPEYVDIFQNGWIFRLMIGTHKQLVLMRQITTSEGLSKHIENPEADRLEAKTEILPKIASALSALGRTHLCYGLTSRLAKRWIASQMLSLYFDDMAIDLMIAYIFVNPGPHTVPNSLAVAFLRFLSLICDHNWKTTPLIVNFENENNEQISEQILEDFTKKRSEYPEMFITTTYDNIMSEWTRIWPDSVIMKRLQVLAAAAKKALIFQMKNPPEINPKVLFGPDLEIYDVVIVLKSDQITNKNQAIDVKENDYLLIKEFDPKLNHRMPIKDFDPIRLYLQKLTQNYSQFGLFFYDKFGGQHIGVIWKPSIFETKPFNDRELNCVRLTNTSDETGLQNIGTNIEALIEDFSILGEGIVDSVDIKTDNWIRH